MKLLSFALACIILCGSANAAPKLGVMWYGKSGMAERVLKGFNDRLKEKGVNFDIEYKINLASEAEAGSVYDRFQNEKDGILFLRSNGAQYMGNHPPKIPGFIGASNNPIELKACSSMEHPDKNFTGVTYYFHSSKHIEYYQKLFPAMRSIALIADENHPSSVIERKETKEACKAANIVYHEILCKTKDDIVKGVKNLAGKVDIFAIGNQALIFDNAGLIMPLAGKTPVVSYVEKPISMKQAVCGITVDDEKLGNYLADSVISVLIDGKKVHDVPIKTDDAPKFVVHEQILKKYGLELPADLAKTAVIKK